MWALPSETALFLPLVNQDPGTSWVSDLTLLDGTETLVLASFLFGVTGSGAPAAPGPSSTFGTSSGRCRCCCSDNASCCRASNWLLGRLQHPSEDAWELCSGEEANDSSLQRDISLGQTNSHSFSIEFAFKTVI